MENFTPLSASIGGALIGVSAVLLMALHGRIAGISGLFSGMVFADRGDRTWRVFFVAGLVLAAPAWLAASGQGIAFDMDAGWPLIVAGGLLVGFGTRLGYGSGLAAQMVTACAGCPACRPARWSRWHCSWAPAWPRSLSSTPFSEAMATTTPSTRTAAIPDSHTEPARQRAAQADAPSPRPHLPRPVRSRTARLRSISRKAAALAGLTSQAWNVCQVSSER